MATLAAVAALVVTTGVSQASPLDSDGDFPPVGIPFLNGGVPDACSVTSSNPKRKNSCNEEGGNGRDGATGEVHGNPRRDTGIRYADQEPDVNGAPGGWGTHRARVAPGAHAPGYGSPDDVAQSGGGTSDSE